MGLVSVAGLTGRSGGDRLEIEFLVDTGSFYSAVSRRLRDELQLAPGMPTKIELADSRVVDAEVTLALLQLLDREGVVPVEVMNVPYPLLGVSALEILGLKVNPVDGTLEYRFPFPGAVTFTRFRPHSARDP